MADFKLPNNTQRLAVIGRTGSGKTQFAAWALSTSSFTSQPWVIVDYKYDPLLNGISRIEELDLKDRLPRKPGLYIIHPRPVADDEAVEEWLLRVWEHERIGLYVDEAYMLPNAAGLRGILTQCRSRRIPAIVLAQRPSWISKFILSESEYLAIFHLQSRRDAQTVEQVLPIGALKRRLPAYCCHWYDVAQNVLFDLQPVPEADVITEMIDSRLRPKSRWG